MLIGRHSCRFTGSWHYCWTMLYSVWILTLLSMMLPSVVQCNTLLVNKQRQNNAKIATTKIINVMDWGAKGDGKTGKLQ